MAHHAPPQHNPHSGREPPATEPTSTDTTPGNFDLDEPPKIPQCLQFDTPIRCSSASSSKTLTCSNCRRCVVEQHLAQLTAYLKQLNPAWQNEIFLCFAETLNEKSLQILVDVLKPMINPVSPATDDVKRDILEKVKTAKKDVMVSSKNTPYREIRVLVNNVTNWVEWFQTVDTASQAIFLYRFLALLDYGSLLCVCVEMEKFLEAKLMASSAAAKPKTQKLIVDSPKSGAVVEIRNGLPYETFLELDGIGMTTVEEQDVFCSLNYKTSRIYKSRGDLPLVAACSDFVVVKSDETPDIKLLSIKPAHAKINPFDPITTITHPKEMQVQKIIVSSRGTFIYAQTGPSVIQAFTKKANTWQTGKSFDLSSDETVTFMESTENELVLLGTSKTRTIIWNPTTNSTEFDLILKDDSWRGQEIEAACFLPSQKLLMVSLGGGSLLLLSLPSGKVRKCLRISIQPRETPQCARFLAYTELFCAASAGKNAFIWEVWNGQSAPRHTLSHDTEIRGMAERKCRVITATSDGAIHVWSLVNGFKLISTTPLPTIGHKLSLFHVLGLNTGILTFVTGIFVVKFKGGDWEKVREPPVTAVAIPPPSNDTIPVAQERKPWRDRLTALLNAATDQIALKNKPEKPSLPPIKITRVIPDKPPIMPALPLEEAMALGQKGAAASLKAEISQGTAFSMTAGAAVQTGEEIEIAENKANLERQMKLLEHHKQFGATREKLIYDKDALGKNSQASTRQTALKHLPISR